MRERTHPLDLLMYFHFQKNKVSTHHHHRPVWYNETSYSVQRLSLSHEKLLIDVNELFKLKGINLQKQFVESVLKKFVIKVLPSFC